MTGLPECELRGCQKRPHSVVDLRQHIGTLTVCEEHAELAEASENGEVVRRVA